MSANKFDIETRVDARLLRITLRGHWDLETVSAYRQALSQAVAQLYVSGCPRGSIVALVDAREAAAQAQDVVAFYKEHLGSSDLAPRRLATLLSSALFKRQVERIAISNQQLFTDEEEAMRWLMER